MEQHGKVHRNKPRGKLGLNLENVIGSVITLKIARGELLMYGRDIYENVEGYTWNKTYYYKQKNIFNTKPKPTIAFFS